MSSAPTVLVWTKVKASSYGTEQGWNVWRRSDGRWNLRSPKGRYWTCKTMAQAKEMALIFHLEGVDY